MKVNAYITIGFCMITFGSLFGTVSYFVLSSTPLTSLGVSAIIIGCVLIAIGIGSPIGPPDISNLMFESSLENISALIEEMGLKSNAIYLPSSMVEKGPLALIPLKNTPLDAKITSKIPRRFIVKYGRGTEDLGILIATPGSIVARNNEIATTSTISDIEGLLNSIIANKMELADKIYVEESDNTLIIEALKPKFCEHQLLANKTLGSILTTIIASIIAEASGKPIMLHNEEKRRGKMIVKLKFLG